MIIPILYLAFAAIATAINLLVQEVTLVLQGNDASILVAMMFGTMTGLVAKYILDKNYIFRYVTTSTSRNMQIFGVYSLMGVVTTFIFWGIELMFYAVFETSLMRNVGAVIGLSISYLLKYQLDKKYVFTSQRVGV
ncbi:GtrA family protein [Vibrio coralliilyticus]|uniref:GtrA family protein n=1 Tax=Vibrio coralliilyticus TaxID=190893 RepID=UPI0006CC6656|nr:GtrA family protein [Vibrio coralliilyticus]AXN31879.1 GtrA family protein [Vibrio coralliilyticus]KPH26588.1 hypothetical protein ADU60_15555 [Vibrio coralliilyticus]